MSKRRICFSTGRVRRGARRARGGNGRGSKSDLRQHRGMGEPVHGGVRRGARQESFNGRLKRFNILAETFRYHHEKHGDVVNALCVLTQYDIENGRPLMDVLV